MKILMFGWEFPPHISGGLGTACFGLTRGLTGSGDTDVIFVVPKTWGDEKAKIAELVGANQVHVSPKWIEWKEKHPCTEFLGIYSEIVPYVSADDFWKQKTVHTTGRPRFVEIGKDGTIPFKGGYGLNLYSEIRNYALVAELIASEKEFDIIHAHDWLSFPAGIAAQNISGKPLVVHVHATEFDRTGGNISSKVYSIEREGMERADKVITVSNLTRETVIHKYDIPPEKVVTVYNAVEPVRIRKKIKPAKRSGEKTVTFMGRITMQKGPEYFVEAAGLLLKRMPGVRFVMAGSGDMMGSMVEQAARMGITDRFHFTGFLDNEEVRHLLAVTDVFVMPSISEPFGIAPLEAMQAGVPVIISKQSGVAEVIRYAFKIDFWDTFAIADAIYGLLKYPALAQMFSKYGRVESGNLTWDATAGQIREIYEKLAAKPASDEYGPNRKQPVQKGNIMNQRKSQL